MRVATATAALTFLLALIATGRETSGFHAFYNPVIHLTDYHQAVPNISWGLSYCCVGDPTNQINTFYEEPMGWQSMLNQLMPTDFYQLTYDTADIRISFITDSAMDAKCGGGAVGCVSYDDGTQCVSACGHDLLHATQIRMWVRASYWSAANTDTRRNLMNHETGHTLGLAEHYANNWQRGHVADTTVYTGVMDNDVADTLGWPDVGEAYGAYWVYTLWY